MSESVQHCSEVFRLRAEGQDFTAVADFLLTFNFLVVKMEDC